MEKIDKEVGEEEKLDIYGVMKGPNSDFVPERQLAQREGDEGVSFISEEEEEDTLSFLLIES